MLDAIDNFGIRPAGSSIRDDGECPDLVSWYIALVLGTPSDLHNWCKYDGFERRRSEYYLFAMARSNLCIDTFAKRSATSVQVRFVRRVRCKMQSVPDKRTMVPSTFSDGSKDTDCSWRRTS